MRNGNPQSGQAIPSAWAFALISASMRSCAARRSANRRLSRRLSRGRFRSAPAAQPANIDSINSNKSGLEATPAVMRARASPSYRGGMPPVPAARGSLYRYKESEQRNANGDTDRRRAR